MIIRFLEAVTAGTEKQKYEVCLQTVEDKINGQIAEESAKYGEPISASAVRFTISMAECGATVMIAFPGK